MSTELTKTEPTNSALGVFANAESFEFAQRMAKALIQSSIIPVAYTGEKGLPNAIIALDMAQRMGESPMIIMQNLDVIHGRPSFGAKYIISKINTCGRYEPLEFEYFGTEGQDDWGCYAFTTEIKTGKIKKGPKVTIGMAKKEGWFGKSGSKWQSMPELMLMYRSGAFWQRMHAPQLTMGMLTSEEVEDIPTTLDIVHQEINEKGNAETIGIVGSEKSSGDLSTSHENATSGNIISNDEEQKPKRRATF